MQWHRALTLEGALSVFLWACSACGSGDSFREPVIVVAASWKLRSHILSDFLSTFPFQELDQVALASHQSRSCAAPCRQSKPVVPGAHLAHGTEQRTQSGGLEWWTDPTVETSMRPVAGPLCAPSCACLVGARAWRGVSLSRPYRLDSSARGESLLSCGASTHRAVRQLSAPRAAARGQSSAAPHAKAVIGSSARRPAAVIGSSVIGSPRGGRRRPSAPCAVAYGPPLRGQCFPRRPALGFAERP